MANKRAGLIEISIKKISYAEKGLSADREYHQIITKKCAYHGDMQIIMYSDDKRHVLIYKHGARYTRQHGRGYEKAFYAIGRLHELKDGLHLEILSQDEPKQDWRRARELLTRRLNEV